MTLDSLIIFVFMFSNSSLRRRKEMVFSDNIKVELNAFKSHSNHKNTWSPDYYLFGPNDLNKSLIPTVVGVLL